MLTPEWPKAWLVLTKTGIPLREMAPPRQHHGEGKTRIITLTLLSSLPCSLGSSQSPSSVKPQKKLDMEGAHWRGHTGQLLGRRATWIRGSPGSGDLQGQEGDTGDKSKWLFIKYQSQSLSQHLFALLRYPALFHSIQVIYNQIQSFCQSVTKDKLMYDFIAPQSNRLLNSMIELKVLKMA